MISMSAEAASKEEDGPLYTGDVGKVCTTLTQGLHGCG